MRTRPTARILAAFALLSAGCAAAQDAARAVAPATIVCPADADPQVKLAARELRRYLYLRTGQLPAIATTAQAGTPAISFAKDATLGQDAYRLRGDGKQLVISGATPLAQLYGAYAFLEKLGVRYYLHGDALPDAKIPLVLPALDETQKPVFPLRGIQPFHDFTQGPDLWEADDYKAVLAQMTKLRMNFIGLHTYTECGWGSEPLVWIGLPEDVGQDGRPKVSYAAWWNHSARPAMGMSTKPTSHYGYGAADLFESEAWGPSVMKGLMPAGKTPEEKNEVFARSGALIKEAFTYAHEKGIKTCVGTEIPLTHGSRMLPFEVREHLKAQGKSVRDPAVHQALYEGIFTRIAQTYPIDYYWLWTPEAWRTPTSDAVVKETQTDLELAVKAAQKVKAPFTLATAGWALGPSQDRAMFDRILPKEMPFAALNLELGTVPVDEGFKRLKGRQGWAIPWMEDDLCLNSMQLWVGRIRRDAFDAASYGCTGLMGIHWRTEEVGPMVAALAQAQWQIPETGYKPAADLPVTALGGQAAAVGGGVHQSVRWGLEGYDIKLPDGAYKVTLQFSEIAYNAPEKRVFGVALQGKTVEPRLDIFARAGGKNKPLDLSYETEAKDGRLALRFIGDMSSTLLDADRALLDKGYKDHPCIAGIVVEKPGDPAFKTIKINCGGGASGDYLADPAAPAMPRHLPTADFYADWATAQFGPEAAADIANIFVKLDGRFPTPDTGCPGGINVNGAPWAQAKAGYAFVDEMAELAPKIQGAGQRARFNQWLGYFRYTRAVGETGCAIGAFFQEMGKLGAIKDAQAKRAFAKDHALPARIALNEAWGRMATLAMETTHTLGGVGVVMGLEQFNRGALDLMHRHDAALETALGGKLPAEAQPWTDYRGEPRLIVATVRSSVAKGESLNLRLIALDKAQAKSVAVKLRPLGRGAWQSVPATHVARAVWQATLPQATEDFEWCVEAQTADGKTLRWPATAPATGQTVVVE